MRKKSGLHLPLNLTSMGVIYRENLPHSALPLNRRELCVVERIKRLKPEERFFDDELKSWIIKEQLLNENLTETLLETPTNKTGQDRGREKLISLPPRTNYNE